MKITATGDSFSSASIEEPTTLGAIPLREYQVLDQPEKVREVMNLSLNEARDLYEQLHSLFGQNKDQPPLDGVVIKINPDRYFT